jgi:hypothetical protein
MSIKRGFLVGLALATLQPAVASADEPVGYVSAKEVTNPPPSTALNAFDNFQVSPIEMAAPYAGQPANEQAKTRLQTYVDERVPAIVSAWNAAEPKHSPPRTLKIEPVIRHVKFVSGKARFWGGAFAGGTAVLLTVKLSDAETGEVIAEPEFYQHANALGAAYSFGGTDKAMLGRTAELLANYLKANYEAAVGGPTGKEPEKEERK